MGVAMFVVVGMYIAVAVRGMCAETFCLNVFS